MRQLTQAVSSQFLYFIKFRVVTGHHLPLTCIYGAISVHVLVVQRALPPLWPDAWKTESYGY